jgi:hypothetical protein
MADWGRDKDIFKKLNKEKPLVKQMDKKSPEILIKRMDPGAGRRTADSYGGRSADTQGMAPKKRSFKEFGIGPGEARQRTNDEWEVRQEQPVRESVRTEKPSAYREAQEEKGEPEVFRPAYRTQRTEAPERPAAPRRTPEKEPNIYAEPHPVRREAQHAAVKAAGTGLHAAARYNISPEHKKERKYRHELKYYINRCDYELLKSAMSGLLVPDRHARGGGYHIRSLYFDDWEESALSEKLDGIKVRKKYRIRIYNKSAGFIRLERKLKNGDLVSKDSMQLSLDEYNAILSGDISFLLERKGKLAHDFYIEMRTNGLRPVVVVDYYREAYEYGVEDVRITFDSDLRSGLFSRDIFNEDLQTMPMYEEGLIVLEVKYNRYLPFFIKAILNNAAYASRSAVSKYLLCRKYE